MGYEHPTQEELFSVRDAPASSGKRKRGKEREKISWLIDDFKKKNGALLEKDTERHKKFLIEQARRGPPGRTREQR